MNFCIFIILCRGSTVSLVDKKRSFCSARFEPTISANCLCGGIQPLPSDKFKQFYSKRWHSFNRFARRCDYCHYFACAIPLRTAYTHFRFCHYKLPLDCIWWSVLPPNEWRFCTIFASFSYMRACAFMRLSGAPPLLYLFVCISLLLVLLLFCCTCLI